MDPRSFTSLQDHVKSVERHLRLTQFYSLLITAALLAILVLSFVSARARAEGSTGVLRVRGLIIEDAQGRARVLIGAPIPQTVERKRKDEATGLIVLGENGSDRVQVGLNPGPQCFGHVSQRISPTTGVTLNDTEGNERGGFGVMDNGTAALGLDYPTCQEAVTAYVLPSEGVAAVAVSAPAKGETNRAILQTTKAAETSLEMLDSEGRKRVSLMLRGVTDPALQIFDVKGVTKKDLFHKTK